MSNNRSASAILFNQINQITFLHTRVLDFWLTLAWAWIIEWVRACVSLSEWECESVYPRLIVCEIVIYYWRNRKPVRFFSRLLFLFLFISQEEKSCFKSNRLTDINFSIESVFDFLPFSFFVQLIVKRKKGCRLSNTRVCLNARASKVPPSDINSF